MRIVTWNINGLGSLKFPFNLHAHHTHAYPAALPSPSSASAAAAASPPLPPDEYDYDEQHDDRAASPPSPPLSASGSSAEAVLVSPSDPTFPAFPSSRLLLTPRVVSSYEQLLESFDADIICLQEVKIARTKLDLLSKAAFVAGYDAFFSFSRRRPVRRRHHAASLLSLACCCRSLLTPPSTLCSELSRATQALSRTRGVAPPALWPLRRE